MDFIEERILKIDKILEQHGYLTNRRALEITIDTCKKNNLPTEDFEILLKKELTKLNSI